MLKHPHLVAAVVFVATWVFAPPARADSIIVQGLGPQKVTVTGFTGVRLQYQTDRGVAGERDYGRIQQLVIDAEPALSAAEAAMAAKQTDASLDDYAKAIRTTATPWVKAFAARRITDLAGPNGRFEPRLTAYLATVQVSPVDAPDRRPTLPDTGSRLLDVAVAQTESALKVPNLADAQKVTLLDFLTELHRRRRDDAAVVATVERMARVSPAAANDPVVQTQLTGLKVAQAKVLAEKKDFAAAARTIEQTRATIVDPQQQADALFVLAQARQVTAAPDAAGQRDAALAFLRVVAHAAALPGRPNVLASLQAAGGILDRAGDRAEAAKLYAQIARDFADDPAAAEARDNAARLSAK